jgi:hypothetical protein
VDSTEFAELLEGLGGDEIALVAEGLRNDLASTEGEVAWWRATIAVSGALRRTRRTREAGVAAHRAACAVVVAARQAGLGDERRTDVSQVARAAAEVARALVAGDVAEPVGAPLLHAWAPVVGGAVVVAA